MLETIGKKPARLLHVFFLFILIAFLVWYMFGATAYHKYEWWNYLASDFECGSLASATGLINDGQPLNHVGYPAVTLYNVHAAVLRTVASLNQNYRDILHLHEMQNIKEVFAMLDKAAHVARLAVLPTMILFAVLMYFLFFYIIKDKFLAFLWTLFLISEKHIIYYNHVMRPEPFSLIFYYLLFFLGILFFARANHDFSLSRCVKYFISIGFLAGCSIFSKVQIVPVLALSFLIMIYFLLRVKKPPRENDHWKTVAGFSLINSLANFLLFPWWTTTRPDNITPVVLSRWPWRELYGGTEALESYAFIPLTGMTFFAAATGMLFLFILNKKIQPICERIAPVILFINLSLSGLILSIYCMNLGGFSSMSSYIANTNNFIYATFATFYFKGQMTHNQFNLNNLVLIYKQFSSVPFFIFSFFYVITAGIIWSVIQIARKKVQNKAYYVYGLLAIGAALMLDILATIRAEIYMFNYGVYSVSFYVLGLVFITAAEIRKINGIRNTYFKAGVLTAVAVMMLYTLVPVVNSIREVRKGVVSHEGKDYKLIFNHCYWQADFFWNMVDRVLYESDDFREAREAGRNLSWGPENQKILQKVKQKDKLRSLLTPEDKIGKLDELILKYNDNLKFNSYFYSYLIESSQALSRRGQPHLALINYDKAVQVFPDFPQAYILRSQLYYDLRNFEKSYEDVKAAQRNGGEIPPEFLEKLKESRLQK